MKDIIPQRFWLNLWLALFIAFLFALMQCKCHGNERLLWALAQVESGDNPHAVGKAGEVTRYQVLPSTLRYIASLRVQEEARSFSKVNALTRSGAQVKDRISGVDGDVLFYLGHLNSKFSSATGRAPTPPEMYALWSIGFHGFQRRGFLLQRCPASKRDAARRFDNLYWSKR